MKAVTTHRPLRFSLRALFCLVLIVCVGLALIAWKREQYRQYAVLSVELSRLDAEVWPSEDDTALGRLVRLSQLYGRQPVIDMIAIQGHRAGDVIALLKRYRLPVREIRISDPLRRLGSELDDLDELEGLKALSLQCLDVSPSGMTAVTNCSALESITLHVSLLNAEDIRGLPALRNLHTCDFVGSKISDSALSVLEQLRSVKQLDLSRTCATSDGVQRLKQSLGAAVWVRVADPLIDKAEVENGLRGAVEASRKSGILRTWIHELDDAAVRTVIKGKLKLTDLDLSMSCVSGGWIPDVCEIGLQRVSLTRTLATSDALTGILSMPGMVSVDVSESKVTAVAMTSQPCDSVLELSVADCAVDDTSVLALCGMKNLQALDISGTDISADGVESLLNGLQNLEMLTIDADMVPGGESGRSSVLVVIPE